VATLTRAPTSDEAVSGTWSGSVGSRWTLVDDYPSVATNDLLTGGTSAASITFGFSAFTVPSGSTSISVQVMYFDGEAANGANNCGGRIKVGGTYYDAATHNPAGTAGTSRTDNWATNPRTGAAWTVDDVNGVGANALQAFGVRSTDSNPTWRFSSIQAQVTYTEPVAAAVGDAAITDAADGSSAAGVVAVDGAASATDAADSISASGAVEESAGASGDAAIVDAADQASAGGAVAVRGTAGGADGADAASAGGAVAILGAASRTDSADTSSAAAGVVVSGSAARVDAVDATSSAGGVAVRGAAAVSDGADVVSAYSGGQQQTAPVSDTRMVLERNRRARGVGRRRR
jgi:hypothetical protein